MKPETVEKLAADIARLIADRAPEEAAPAVAPPLLTASDVAARLHINTQAVYRLAREGKLPAVLIGPRTKRWTEEVVSAFVAQGGVSDQSATTPKTLRLLQASG